MSIKIIVIGAAGRVGRELVKAVRDQNAVLQGTIDKMLLGADSGELAGIGKNNIRITEDLEEIIQGADVTIDFSSPESTVSNIKLNEKYNIPAVVGTTGLSDSQKKTIENAAQKTPVLFSPNMSIGVNLLFKLSALAAQILRSGFDVEVIEAHHRYKKDAPSGTAVKLVEILAKELKRDLKKDIVYGREGITGERKNEEIGVLAVRGGDIVGDHTVLFAGIGERVELIHKASSRYTFARGAVQAARWLAEKKENGLYTMFDVLGL